MEEIKDLLNLDSKAIEKKLKLASDLFEMAYEIKKEQLKKKHPHLTVREINWMAYSLIEKGCNR